MRGKIRLLLYFTRSKSIAIHTTMIDISISGRYSIHPSNYTFHLPFTVACAAHHQDG